MRRILSVVVCYVIFSGTVFSQVSKSPFTAQGIGEVNNLSMVHNNGMAGVGISSASLWYMNAKNPALLPFNALTVFSAGFATERRTVESSDASSIASGGNVTYLGTALPIINGRWTMALGLTPYSTVDYSYTRSVDSPDSNGEILLTNSGEGGFNQVYWSNGVRIGNSFYIGAKASYLFSSIVEQNQNFASDSTMVNEYIVALYDRISVSDIMLSAGAAFSKDSIFNRDIDLTVGVTYDFASEVSATSFRTLERRNLVNLALEADTLIDMDGSISLPSAYGFGITLANNNKWKSSLEVEMQGWSEYKNFNGSNENLSDGLRVAIGGEYVPDYSSVTNYFKRITYRAGFSYANLPFTVNNYQVKEIGINFGLSLPVSRFSSIDLAFKYANRGDVAETTIQENVLRFGLGITFNDQWFIRRKYD